MNILNVAKAGWLGDLTDWLVDQIKAVWNALVAFLGDLFLTWVQHTIDMLVWVLAKIPVPDFLTSQSLGTMLGNAGPTVLWFCDVFMIPQCMSVLASAMVFSVIRKLVTVGIW